jgi:salicylate hydroxylase
MGSIEEPRKPSTVLVVGAGIGGLFAAVALSGKNLDVTVLESNPELTEFGASISVDPYAIKAIRSYGLEDSFLPYVTPNRYIDLRDGVDNKVLGALFTNEKNHDDILYGAPKWHIHRADYQQLLAKGARQYGTQILFNAEVIRVDVDTNTVHLKDGRSLSADLIIGADGIRSSVRKSIPATANAPLLPFHEVAYRCTVEKSHILNNPNLSWLLGTGVSTCWLMKGKYVLSWPMPENRAFDLVCCIGDPGGVPDGYWGIRADPRQVAAYFDDACPELRQLLTYIGPCIQWRLCELPPLETCRSEKGGVVLLGDAWHAMLPHMGSGGSSAIEDGAVLGECLAWAQENRRSIAEATAAYEHLRTIRVRKFQEGSQVAVGFTNGQNIDFRNKYLAERLEIDRKELARPEEERRRDPKPEPNVNAYVMDPQFRQWLYGYDAVGEARKYLAAL